MKIRTTRRVMNASADAIDPSVRYSEYREINYPDPLTDYLDEIVEYDAFDSEFKEGVIVFQVEGWNSMPIEHPTYGDMFKQFANGQRARGDEHHIFFEGWNVSKLVGGVTVVSLHSGS